MKSIYKIQSIAGRFFLGGMFAVMALTACTDAVEKTDLSKVTDDIVWGDADLVRGYFNNTMYATMPGSESRQLVHSDEGYSNIILEASYDNFNVAKADGGGTWANVDRWPYEGLRKINRFLDHAGYDGFESPQPVSSKLPQADKENMIGHMLVLRAYHYFDLVRTYGGVPYLSHEQNSYTKLEDLYTSRLETSKCIEMIIKDLDAAIALPDASFPMKSNDGHIGKAVAYALKGKVLLYYACPQFTKQIPAGVKSAEQRWTEAYDACKTAYDKLKAAGYGLYAEEGGDRQTVVNNYYKMLVTDEMNKEMIWVRRYVDIQNYGNGVDKEFRPMSSSGNGNMPTWEMVASFANADGTPFTAVQVDNSKTGTTGDLVEGSTVTKPGSAVQPDGSAINTSVFWLDREPRFYAFIGYNGCEWPLIRKMQADFASDVVGGKMQHEWIFTWGENVELAPFSRAYTGTTSMGQGFFVRKFVRDDRNYELQGTNPLNQCGTDWPLFRFAEVMLNYAEAAAKTGKPNEAYSMVNMIRKRAGIPSDNNYGLGNKTGDALILDILNERKIELFVETQRYYDARRWCLYEDGLAGFKLNGTRRHTIQPWLKDKTLSANKSELVKQLQSIINAGGIETQAGRDAYFDVFYHTVMLYDAQPIHYNPSRQDFMRIPYETHIMKNPVIEQTIGWTDERGPGKFNPYE